MTPPPGVSRKKSDAAEFPGTTNRSFDEPPVRPHRPSRIFYPEIEALAFARTIPGYFEPGIAAFL
jgi:hypothetical protein